MHWPRVIPHQLLADEKNLRPPMSVLVECAPDGAKAQNEQDADQREVGQCHDEPQDTIERVHGIPSESFTHQ